MRVAFALDLAVPLPPNGLRDRTSSDRAGKLELDAVPGMEILPADFAAGPTLGRVKPTIDAYRRVRVRPNRSGQTADEVMAIAFGQATLGAQPHVVRDLEKVTFLFNADDIVVVARLVRRGRVKKIEERGVRKGPSSTDVRQTPERN